MAVKYIHIPEEKKTIAVLPNTKFSAVDRIVKVVGQTNSLCFNPNKYLMNNFYRAVVVCHDEDSYSPEEGERQAKMKLMNHYYEQLDKTLDRFVNDLNTAMFEVTNRLSCTRKNRENA